MLQQLNIRLGKHRAQQTKEQADNESHFCDWRNGKIDEFRENRDYHLRAYHNWLQFILKHGLLHSAQARAAELCEEHERLYHAVDILIDTFAAIPETKLRSLFDREQRRNAA
ncbi:MAG TPA: hypothetical protein VEX68_05050 [Bryobacteraceae bacterium]|nr:hypothetical protein [Bryobacteraceae bacterium]